MRAVLTLHHCPRCRCPELHRSHIRLYERPYKLATSRRPFRCHDCGWRGWVVYEPLEHTSPQTPGSSTSVLPKNADVDLKSLDDREQP